MLTKVVGTQGTQGEDLYFQSWHERSLFWCWLQHYRSRWHLNMLYLQGFSVKFTCKRRDVWHGEQPEELLLCINLPQDSHQWLCECTCGYYCYADKLVRGRKRGRSTVLVNEQPTCSFNSRWYDYLSRLTLVKQLFSHYYQRNIIAGMRDTFSEYSQYCA